MYTKKLIFVPVLLTAILLVPAYAKLQLPLSESEPFLIASPNPALADIEPLKVSIVFPGTEPNNAAIAWEELRSEVEHKLKQAGIKYVKPRSSAVPELKIDVEMLEIAELKKYVIRVQTSLMRGVILPNDQNVHLASDVWKRTCSNTRGFWFNNYC